MPYSRRLLESGKLRLLESGGARDLESIPPPSETVGLLWPKTAYSWTDRWNITGPDYSGPAYPTALQPFPCADAGSLVICADGSVAGGNVIVLVTLLDERGWPITSNLQAITISTTTFMPNEPVTYCCAAAIVQYVQAACSASILVSSISSGATINLHYKLF